MESLTAAVQTDENTVNSTSTIVNTPDDGGCIGLKPPMLHYILPHLKKLLLRY